MLLFDAWICHRFPEPNGANFATSGRNRSPHLVGLIGAEGKDMSKVPQEKDFPAENRESLGLKSVATVIEKI
jgi:hypothetical protein